MISSKQQLTKTAVKNTLHEKTKKTLNIKSCFCKPYHSWDKGSVENFNKPVRRFIPKKTI